jgi:hypothetical protein
MHKFDKGLISIRFVNFELLFRFIMLEHMRLAFCRTTIKGKFSMDLIESINYEPFEARSVIFLFSSSHAFFDCLIDRNRGTLNHESLIERGWFLIDYTLMDGCPPHFSMIRSLLKVVRALNLHYSNIVSASLSVWMFFIFKDLDLRGPVILEVQGTLDISACPLTWHFCIDLSNLLFQINRWWWHSYRKHGVARPTDVCKCNHSLLHCPLFLQLLQGLHIALGCFS